MFKKLTSRKTALAAAIILLVVALSAMAAGLFPLKPYDQDILSRLLGPTVGHPMGTDQLGRDLLSRIIYGGRVSLSIALLSVCIATFLGSVMGILAGYYGGVVDSIIMGLSEALLSLPFVLLAIAVIGAVGPSTANMVIVLAGTGWVTHARLLRGKVMELKSEQYVEAARAIGLGDMRIMSRHILPNAMSLVLVEATLQLGYMVLAEASLGFLGLGIQPPSPSWGNMLAEGQAFIWQAWWVSVFPGAALAITVLSFNILGDFMRDCLDPSDAG